MNCKGYKWSHKKGERISEGKKERTTGNNRKKQEKDRKKGE